MRCSGSRNRLITVLHSQVVHSKNKKLNSPAPKDRLNPEEVEREPSDLQKEYISQLKDNNKVLKDLIRNKNKEIVSLEMTIKKDKVAQRKEVQGFKKEIKLLTSHLKKYQDFVKALLGNYMDVAMPVIWDDVHIVTDWSHMMWLPDNLESLEPHLAEDNILPEGFEEQLEKVKETVKKMQDQDQGDEEDFEDSEEEEEQQDTANFEPQTVHYTEPQMRKPLVKIS